MQKMSFVLGLLVGAAVATAWAQIPVSAGVDSSERVSIINPVEMMAHARLLPVEAYDAF
jgi:hypothetical protein